MTVVKTKSIQNQERDVGGAGRFGGDNCLGRASVQDIAGVNSGQNSQLCQFFAHTAFNGQDGGEECHTVPCCFKMI